MLEYNYVREAVEVYREVGSTWSLIADQTHDDIDLKHELLIKVTQSIYPSLCYILLTSSRHPSIDCKHNK